VLKLVLSNKLDVELPPTTPLGALNNQRTALEALRSRAGFARRLRLEEVLVVGGGFLGRPRSACCQVSWGPGGGGSRQTDWAELTDRKRVV